VEGTGVTEDRVRRSLLIKAAMEVLREHGGKMHPTEVLNEIGRRITLTPRELSLDNSGAPRFDRAVGFDTGYAATVGWTSKIGGWSITDAGIEALETYPEADELWTEFNRLYRGDRPAAQAGAAVVERGRSVHCDGAAAGGAGGVDRARRPGSTGGHHAKPGCRLSRGYQGQAAQLVPGTPCRRQHSSRRVPALQVPRRGPAAAAVQRGSDVRPGHLVYAAGNEEPATHLVRQAGTEIVCHALDLSAPPAELFAGILALTEFIASASSAKRA